MAISKSESCILGIAVVGVSCERNMWQASSFGLQQEVVDSMVKCCC